MTFCLGKVVIFYITTTSLFTHWWWGIAVRDEQSVFFPAIRYRFNFLLPHLVFWNSEVVCLTCMQFWRLSIRAPFLFYYISKVVLCGGVRTPRASFYSAGKKTTFFFFPIPILLLLLLLCMKFFVMTQPQVGLSTRDLIPGYIQSRYCFDIRLLCIIITNTS